MFFVIFYSLGSRTARNGELSRAYDEV